MSAWGRRVRWRRFAAVGLSLAVHSLLFLVVIRGTPPRFVGRRPTLLIVPPRVDDRERTIPTPLYVPQTDQGWGRGREPFRMPEVIPPEVPDSLVPQPVSPQAADSVSIRRGPPGRLGAALGDGRLWVRPLPLPPRDLARRLEPTHLELVDSAVQAIVQQYLDSMAREPGADAVPLPDWTTEIDGVKFGLDSRNIYFAGLRIPSVVLALLPIPATGNQSRALDKSGAWITEDLHRAVERAVTLDDFKAAVRELRERRQRDKDLQRAQREAPDSARTRE